jgi:hypothetical protein
VEYLKQKGKRANSGEIYRAIVGMGVIIKGDKPATRVAARLRYASEIFDHVRGEGFGLRAWSNGSAPFSSATSPSPTPAGPGCD